MGYYDVASQLSRHLYTRAQRAWDEADQVRDGVRTPQDLAARQRFLRAVFLEAIGGLPAQEGPVPAIRRGTILEGGIRIERLLLEFRPRCLAPALLYLPEGRDAPTGAVLFLCGHYEHAKLEDDYRRACRGLAAAGLAVLIYDPPGQGERLSYYDPTLRRSRIGWGCPEHEYANWQAWPLGGSPLRWFLHDAIRALDYLASRPEVDPERLGVTGSSGGGSMACALMIVEERLRSAAPATFVTGLTEYTLAGGALDSEETWPGIRGLSFDHEDALLCFAPRPALVLAARSDFFPIEGTRRTVSRARRLYGLMGREGDLRLLEEDTFHSYTPAMAQEAAAFLAEHLARPSPCSAAGPPTPLSVSAEGPLLDRQELLCTRSGQVSEDFPDARFPRHEIAEAAADLEGARQRMPEMERQRAALAWLRERVDRDRIPCMANLRVYAEDRLEDLPLSRLLWWAQEGVLGHAFLLRSATDPVSPASSVEIAVWDGGTSALNRHLPRIRSVCRTGGAALVLDVSGVGALLPNDVSNKDPWEDEGITYLLAHALIRLNDSLPALRVYDVLRAAETARALPGLEGIPVRLYGAGRYALYAVLAALLDERIEHVTVESRLESVASWVGAEEYEHRDVMSVAFPGILAHLDLPDAARWLGARLREA
jgi:hypothetical protein